MDSHESRVLDLVEDLWGTVFDMEGECDTAVVRALAEESVRYGEECEQRVITYVRKSLPDDHEVVVGLEQGRHWD